DLLSSVTDRLDHIHLICVPAPATIDIFTLSLHDALPICLCQRQAELGGDSGGESRVGVAGDEFDGAVLGRHREFSSRLAGDLVRSEEHTSELQSHLNLVCRLLLEYKKKYLICSAVLM